MSETIADQDLRFFRHEMANVLMTVRGYAELMLLRKDLNPELRHCPEQIIQAVDRATHTLEQLRPSATNDPIAARAPNSPKSEKRIALSAFSAHKRTG